MSGARQLVLPLALLFGLLAGCATARGPRSPEECKVMTDPEACRKYYENR